jgi:predicted lipoprotein with Yx(FWY)xxD motif
MAARATAPQPAVHSVPLAVMAALSAVLLAACGSTSGGRPDYSVTVGTVAGLGRVLVDGNGHTLYMYVPDHQGRSTCYGTCAEQWPPLLLPRGVRHPVAGPGLNAGLLGTVPRKDGAIQVTYNGWPLYLYVVDVQAGEATGQADDMGLWYVLSPNGSVDRRTPTGQTS